MRTIVPLAFSALLSFCCSQSLHASLSLPLTTAQQVQSAAAVFRGAVVGVESYRDPGDDLIYTRTVVRVNEVFKGKLPALVKLVHRGGLVGDAGEIDGLTPQMKIGEERLFFVSCRADGTLFAARGDAGALKVPGDATASVAGDLVAGATILKDLRALTATGSLTGNDLSDQAATPADFSTPVGPNRAGPLSAPVSTATNLMVGTDGIPARFILPDRAEPIPYLIDADFLPAGMTQSQAVNAVKTALGAWTNVTSLRYSFAGIQSFGQASPNVSASDGVLRIQLHDHYNYIPANGGVETLGVGGRGWTVPTPLPSPGWTAGGNVIGSDFHKTARGYIVLAHTNVFMQNLANFTEVLCHEIGHTIGLAHSSQNQFETNPLLKQAIMYYLAHGDGRGASLNTWDINVSRQVHPPINTPPYCYDRVMDIVTSPIRPINTPGVNTVQVRGYDLQTTSLSFATTDATANNGSFTVVNSNITFTPNGYFNGARLDPAANTYYDAIYARCSDGVNASPYVMIRVISFNTDAYSEGIPDSWRITYFGNANPSVGSNHHAADDADGDGFSNLQEYWLGSTPTDPTSNLRITSFATTNLQWQAKGYEVYELHCSTNLSTWTRAINPLTPTTSLGTATGFTNGSPRQVFRIQKVP